MSRELEFTRADVSVSMLDDPKMRRLWRNLRDPDRQNAAVLTYLAVVLASWAAVDRVSALDAVPFWMDEPDLGPLAEAGLLDDDGRLPEHAYQNWLGPAVERTVDSKRRAIFGGLKRQGADNTEANAEAARRMAETMERHGFDASSLKAQPSNLSLKAQPTGSASSSNHPTVQPSDQPREDGEDGRMGGPPPAASPSASSASGVARQEEEPGEVRTLPAEEMPWASRDYNVMAPNPEWPVEWHKVLVEMTYYQGREYPGKEEREAVEPYLHQHARAWAWAVEGASMAEILDNFEGRRSAVR